MKSQNTYYCYMETPIGRIAIEEDEKAITALYMYDDENNGIEAEEDKSGSEYDVAEHELEGSGRIYCNTPLLQEAKEQLEEYFAGKRKEFDLPISSHGTEFQKKVWNALRQIPYGETRSYREIAVQIGNPKACRAIGGANNKNPIMIIVPCHRVIGADGSLVGFGGGLPAKEYLLALERKYRYSAPLAGKPHTMSAF